MKPDYVHLFVLVLFTFICTSPGMAGDWQRSNEPVITPGEGAGAKRVRNPFVVRDGEMYRMWFEGYWGKDEILYATSKNGRNWESYAHFSPVIPGGRREVMTGSPSVHRDENGVYHMWYSYQTSGYGGDGSTHVGYATSLNGHSWERYRGNPVVAQDEISTKPERVSVVKHNGRYHLWGAANSVAYATSDNGIEWEQQGKVEFTEQQEGWIHGGAVTIHDGTFVMAYAQRKDDENYVRFASSTDGTTWEPDFLPVLKHAANFSPPVRDGNEWRIWSKFTNVEEDKFAIWHARYKE